MGIVPTIILFVFVAWVNVINSKYLIESNDGIRKRVVPAHRSSRNIHNDYGNLMFEVALYTPFLCSCGVILDITFSFSFSLLLYGESSSEQSFFVSLSPPMVDRCDGQH